MLGLTVGSIVVFASTANGQAMASADEADAPHPSHSVLAQPAGLVVEGLPLTAALMALSESSGVVLAFSPSLASEVSHKVSCDCASRTVGQASLRLENLTDSDAVEWNNLSPSRGRQTTVGLRWKP